MEKALTKDQNKSSKAVMLFILAMALSGLENLVAEIIPELQIGPIELGISSFIFIPIILCVLFDNIWVALAAPIGEIVFADLLLGEFGGLGEFEEVILLTVGLLIAGRIVKDVNDRKQLILAVVIGFGFEELAATLLDMSKVWIGVEQLEAVAGLPESIFAIESIDFLVEFVITGIVFGLLPTLYFAPRLHGKLEPLLGIKPRQPDDAQKTAAWKLVLAAVLALALAAAISILAAMGHNIVEWEADFLDRFGDSFIFVAIGAAALVTAAVCLVLTIKPKKQETLNAQ